MSQGRWFRGLGAVVSRGGGGHNMGVSKQEGRQKLGSDTPNRRPLNALLAGLGVQAPWQAAASAPSTACQRRAGKNPVWHHSLSGELTDPCSPQPFATRSFPTNVHQGT